MQLNELRDPNLSRKYKKCLGRGIGCSKGKTCGKGHKGQKARTGNAIKGFEGGQMPLERRLPKRGFNNARKNYYAVVSLDRIRVAIDSGKIDQNKEIDINVLKNSGLIRKSHNCGVKVLNGVDFNLAIVLNVNSISKSALETLSNCGSKVNVI